MKNNNNITKKTFDTIKTKIQEMEEEDSDITESDSESASSFLKIESKFQLMLQKNSNTEK